MALNLHHLTQLIQGARAPAAAHAIHPSYTPDGPVDSGYNPAVYQRGMGNDAQAYRDWMAHHPGAVAGRAPVPDWVRAYRARQLQAAMHGGAAPAPSIPYEPPHQAPASPLASSEILSDTPQPSPTPQPAPQPVPPGGPQDPLPPPSGPQQPQGPQGFGDYGVPLYPQAVAPPHPVSADGLPLVQRAALAALGYS